MKQENSTPTATRTFFFAARSALLAVRRGRSRQVVALKLSRANRALELAEDDRVTSTRLRACEVLREAEEGAALAFGAVADEGIHGRPRR